MSAHHTIGLVPVKASRTEDYGVIAESGYVYRTSRSGGFPTRVQWWDNSRRMQADGTYLDPDHKPTTERRTFLLSPEAVCINSSGTGGSGQVYGDGVIRPGDTVTLVTAHDNLGRFTAVFTNNGHGYLTPAE